MIQTKIQERLHLSAKEISDFCSENQVQELSLFGSALRDDFHGESDLDFLVA